MEYKMMMKKKYLGLITHQQRLHAPFFLGNDQATERANEHVNQVWLLIILLHS